MIERLQPFLARVASWPRAMRWALWATCMTLAFLVWDSTIARIGANWSMKAAAMEEQIAKVNSPIHFTASVRNAITSFGEIKIPRDKTLGTTAMTGAVHEILGSHPVRNDKYARTKTTRMRAGVLPGIAQGGKHVEQIIGDILFEATQEVVLKVIADLESSPWIDAISNVRLTKKDGRMIRVDLLVEAWVVTSSQRRRRR